MNGLSFSTIAANKLDEIAERLYDSPALEDADISSADGVITIELADGAQIVLNRQEPLRQIWLSSPEGPARFDYDAKTQGWHHEETGVELVATLGAILGRLTGSAVTL